MIVPALESVGRFLGNLIILQSGGREKKRKPETKVRGGDAIFWGGSPLAAKYVLLIRQGGKKIGKKDSVATA